MREQLRCSVGRHSLANPKRTSSVHGGPKGLVDASYVWLPIRFHERSITIPKLWKWDYMNPDGPTPPAPPPPAPPLVPGSCVSAAPGRGGALALAVCGAPNVSTGQAWVVQGAQAEKLQLRTAKLCVDQVASQRARLVLGDCEAPDTPLQFSYSAETGRLVEKTSGKCMDITYCGTQVCADATVGLYTCNSVHQNQEFDWDAGRGHLVARINKQCLTGCGSAAPAGKTLKSDDDTPLLLESADLLTLTNGLVSLSFAKDSAGRARPGIDKLQLHSLPGVNLLAAPTQEGGGKTSPKGYWDLDTRWCAGLSEGKCRPHCAPTSSFSGHSVVRNSSSLLEVRFQPAPSCGFSVALHYVLKPAEAGFHMFAVVTRDPAAPLNNTFGQSRLVLRLEPTIFTSSAVVDESAAQQPQTMRTAEFPAGKLLRDPCDDQGCHKVMDATYRLTNGSAPHSLHGTYYTKYEWASASHADSVHGTYGLASGKHVGAFIVSGSNEYLNGGPVHPELSVHMTDTTPCLLKMVQGSHDDYYDPTPAAAAPESWSKLFGPFFVSLATAASPQELWAGAAALAQQHQKQWPPGWMQHALWKPATARGSLSGTLSAAPVANPLSPTFVMLGEVGSRKPIAAQGTLSLVFWSEVEADGSFTIENAVVGTYSLWVRTPGVLPIEQVVADSVTITAGATTKHGHVVVPNALGSASSVVWQIGEVDASVAEFRWGKDAELHGWALWLAIINAGMTNTSIDLGPRTSDQNRTAAQATQLPFMQLLAGQTEGAQDTSARTTACRRFSLGCVSHPDGAVCCRCGTSASPGTPAKRAAARSSGCSSACRARQHCATTTL